MAHVGAMAGGKSLSYALYLSYPARLAHIVLSMTQTMNNTMIGNVGEASVMDSNQV